MQPGPQHQCQGVIIASQSPANTLSAAAAACTPGHSHVTAKLGMVSSQFQCVLDQQICFDTSDAFSLPLTSLLTIDNWTIPFSDSSSRPESEHLNSDEFQIILCSTTTKLFHFPIRRCTILLSGRWETGGSEPLVANGPAPRFTMVEGN